MKQEFSVQIFANELVFGSFFQSFSSSIVTMLAKKGDKMDTRDMSFDF